MTDYNVFPDYKTRKEIINELCDRYKFIKHCFAGKACAEEVLMFCTSATPRIVYSTAAVFTARSTSQYLPC